MQIQRFGLFAAVMVVLGMGSAVQAAPLNLKQVPASAKWVGHLDMDAVKSSVVVKQAWAKLLEKHPDADRHILLAAAFIGFDPRTDLGGITAYGSEVGQETGVLIVNVKANQELLNGYAQTAPDHKTIPYNNTTIHTWTHKDRRGARTFAGAFFGREHIVIASSVDELKSALDLLGGKGASVGDDSPLGGKIPAGTVVMFRAAGINQAKAAQSCDIARQVEAFRFVLGEAQGESFFRLRVHLTNPEITGNMKEIAEGARAMGILHAGKDPVEKTLAQATQVKVEGNTLTVLWSGPAESVWQVIQKRAKEHAERMAKWRARHAGDKKSKTPDKPKSAPKKPAEEI